MDSQSNKRKICIDIFKGGGLDLIYKLELNL